MFNEEREIKEVAPHQACMAHAEATWELLSEEGRMPILNEIGLIMEAEVFAKVEWKDLIMEIRNMVLEYMHNHPVGYFALHKREPLHIQL